MLHPSTIAELANALRDAAERRQTITLLGRNSKPLMGGPLLDSDIVVSTTALKRVLQYEPRDLTISVEAGLPYAELERILAENGQMVPLDPPFADESTVGGVIAANLSGPRRRLYGSARDMVIGMSFVTLEGKSVQSGGMVVKNVAGLDMAKIMIGSFGTLAAIAVVNFKLQPVPPGTRTFIQEFASVKDAMDARDSILKSVLQPAALDIVKTNRQYRLLARASGTKAVLDRYARELPRAEPLDGDPEERLWREIREFTPGFLASHPESAVVRIPCTLSEVGVVLESLPDPAIARAGTGVCYGYFANWSDAFSWQQNGRGIVEFAPAAARAGAELWPAPGSDFAIMKKVKQMFDPHSLLNRRRLYARL